MLHTRMVVLPSTNHAAPNHGNLPTPSARGPEIQSAQRRTPRYSSSYVVSMTLRVLRPSPPHKTTLQHFPTSVLEMNGRPALEAIETMSGRKVPGQSWGKISPAGGGRGEDRVPLLMEQYRHMLRFLVEKGCLLNSVRPEVCVSVCVCARARVCKYSQKLPRALFLYLFLMGKTVPCSCCLSKSEL